MTKKLWQKLASISLFPLAISISTISANSLPIGLLAVKTGQVAPIKPPTIDSGAITTTTPITIPRLVWGLIDALPVKNKEALKIINRGEGGETNDCNIDKNGLESCGPFQFQKLSWSAWSKASGYGFTADDIYDYSKQILLADYVLDRGRLCIFGTAWDANPRTLFHSVIVAKLRSIFGSYKCTKTTDVFYPKKG